MFAKHLRLSSLLRTICGLGALLIGLAVPEAANAVPSFARQTGLACEACHTVFPQLTPFGRDFKASGYTLFNTSKIQDINALQQSTLSLSDLPPLSIMVIASTSSVSVPNDPNSAKVSTDFPQQLSFFYSGRITDNMGAYIQATYSDVSGKFGTDNTDIRYADVARWDNHNIVYGLSLNNNPTVQDLWNSTPAWGLPFPTSPALQVPIATPQIEGKLAQLSLGLTAYTYIDQSIFFESGVYRTALQGASVAFNGNLDNNVISSVAPYWRLAYEHDWRENSFEFGTYGLETPLRNPTTPAGNAINGSLQHTPTDRFLDIGLDSQYQYIDDIWTLTVDGRWTHENQDLNASYMAGFANNPHDSIEFESLLATFYWHRKFGATVNFTHLSGKTDGTYFGTPSGRPNSTSGVYELDYMPWLNVRVGLQYTAYYQFDGATINYNGVGRDARNNNVIYGYLWFAF